VSKVTLDKQLLLNCKKKIKWCWNSRFRTCFNSTIPCWCTFWGCCSFLIKKLHFTQVVITKVKQENQPITKAHKALRVRCIYENMCPVLSFYRVDKFGVNNSQHFIAKHCKPIQEKGKIYAWIRQENRLFSVD